ncbi:para-aminobenzoic acid synthetase [Plasmodium sp. gorilla clade G2]|uniref:para-aminobenzoic acid synthetase n=1 Tax=Plasmodium sp. gorilla clade G2 TaxID=880535 RepID=UPI000D210F98|nr:para-aminobenzoic acid synthetase [Plasmodium sp. gorilla clade G2]SOV14331.1 para-aminobenzoic acid synthetase [Plasmodium sp. gorilla clade G2]
MQSSVVSLFIDFYDSYSYNIVHYLTKINKEKPIVIKADDICYDDFMKDYYDKIDNIVISPGYGNPMLNDKKDKFVIELLKNEINIPLLGVCYGHQLLCYFYGSKIEKVKNMFHGNTNIIHICKNEENKYCELFNNIEDNFKAVCYNSLKVNHTDINKNILNITCYSNHLDEYIIMGVQHKYLPYYTVQYHPESVESEYSEIFFENFKNITLKYNENKKRNSLKILQHDINKTSISIPLNISSTYKWKIKIIKVVGIKNNLCMISYDIFKNIFFKKHKESISFWLDSNNEILYQIKNNKSEKKISNDNISLQYDHTDLIQNTRFSYMGNLDGILSDIIEYYIDGKDNISANTLLLNLRKSTKEKNDKSDKSNIVDTYDIHYISKENNCLVKYMNENIEYFKKQMIIDYQYIDIHNLINSKNEVEEKEIVYTTTQQMKSDKYNSTCEEQVNKNNKKKKNFNNHRHNYIFLNDTIQDNDFINNKTSCLMGYFGFFNYEYKYETIKNLYNTKCKQIEQEEMFPVSVFVRPQNMMALDMYKNNIYLISLEPEEESFKRYLTYGHKKSEDNISCCDNKGKNNEHNNLTNSPYQYHIKNFDAFKDIQNYNKEWTYNVLDVLIDIEKTYEHDNILNEEKYNINNIYNKNNLLEKNKEQSRISFNSIIQREQYIENVRKCKKYIEDGYSYELCLTTQFISKKLVDINIEYLDLYNYIRNINKVSYSCFINYKRILCKEQNGNKEKISFLLKEKDKKKIKIGEIQFHILSFSPEEFLRKNKDNYMYSKPIKGTSKRGKTKEEDDILKNNLFNNKKERAENLMILDLTINDFNRICDINTVQVSKLFHIESYKFVHQMVSEITGKIKKGNNFSDAILNIFPGGSMTGSPKFISMSILQEIEMVPRGIYSGCIGFLTFEGNFIFNIVIRTIIIKKDMISIGAGGAITIKSNEEDEYNEMILKFMSIAKPISLYLKEYHNTDVEYIL